jgi:undecaprenyl pyrophosphate phosphatase UppP
MYSILACSQIIIPLLNGIPRALQRRKFGKVLQMLITILIWVTISYFAYNYISKKIPRYLTPINIGLIIGGLMILWKSIFGGKDLEADLNDSYGL